jgi:hypothetical protein
MSKTTGKLKYDLALATTTVYDASSVYVNKSAELSINGNANLEYKTVGPTYSSNLSLIPSSTQFPGPSVYKGKAYLYVRNLGPSNGATIRLSTSTIVDNTDNIGSTGASGADGIPDNYDPNQFADLAVNEFAFFPVALGASSANIYVRSSFVPGSTYWTGATHSDIEYMLCFTNHNTGPTF